MAQRKIQNIKRILSILCVLAVIFTSMPMNSSTLSALAAGQKQASQTERFMYDDAVLYMNKDIQDNSNGYFTLTIDAAAYLKKTDSPNSVQESEDGIFEIKHDGYYLLELWGGRGGNGSDSAESDGGVGGSGGHVYGYMYLEKGQTIVYTIGTNGRQIPGLNIGGGGENEGGDKEGYASYATGGGGGYSAVYLFDGEHSTTITEEERVNNYIMVAGGGGGGAAGNQLGFENQRIPNGGAGGHITGARRGTLTAAENNGVGGTWFGGDNGYSSGSSTDHVGRGGTNYIGETATTILNYTYVGTSANDWIGSYSYQAVDTDGDGAYIYEYVPAGQGGAGFLRGGAGGAGFCGGSGGIQDGLLLATNIGGGGGGSSFISDKLTWSDVLDKYNQYIEGYFSNPVGGKINITYLGAVEIDQTKYDTVDAEFQISQYFDVVSSEAVNVDGSDNGTLTVSKVGTATNAKSTSTKISVIGANISPDDTGLYENHLYIRLLLRAKTGFAGGNMVPVFDSQPSLRAEKTGSETSTMAENTATDYVNVPLNFKAVANSYASSDTTKAYAVSSLYTDNYASVRSNLSNYWQYDFISAVSAYSVSGYSTSGTVNPQTTTNYTVSFTVTPITTSTADIGAAVAATTYSATAVITILPTDTFVSEAANNPLQRDITIHSGKSLNYHANTGFTFGIDSDISFEEPSPNVSYTTGGPNNSERYYTIPADGWYYIEALGGAGGGAGSSEVQGKNDTTSQYGASAGRAKGGYTGGFIHLTKDTVITVTLGTMGTSSGNSFVDLPAELGARYDYTSTAGGGGGKSTSVAIGDTVVMVAGGGGGAGGSGAAGRMNYSAVAPIWTQEAEADAKAATDGAVLYVAGGTLDSAYDKSGTSGGRGSANVYSTGSLIKTWYATASSGSTGSASPNYISNVFFQPASDGEEIPAFIQANYKTYQKVAHAATAGNAAITCILSDAVADAAEQLSYDFEASGAITRYFEVDDIEMNFSASVNSPSVTTDGGWTTKIYKDSTVGAEVGRFTYKITTGLTDSEGVPYTKYEIKEVASPISTTSTTVNAKPSFSVKLSVAEGFVGGYDVPILKNNVIYPDEIWESKPDCGVAIKYKEKGMFLTEQNATDYANVPIAYTMLEENFEVVSEKTITCGESVNQSELIVKSEIPLPSGADAWKAEFVEAVHPTTSTVSPTSNTTYSFTQQVKPKGSAAMKAVTASSISPVTFTKSSRIKVNYTVTTNLTNLTYEGPEFVLDDTALTATLQTEMGYDLPTSITVKRGSSTLSTSYYTYDSKTGELTIPASNVTNNITITATATPTEHTLYYLYLDPKDNDVYKQYSEKYIADAAINLDWYNEFNTNIPAKEGHSFVWDWATDGNQPLEKMPAYDYFVYGMYVKNQYTLTVNYYKEGTKESVAPSHTEQVYFEDAYNVLSPQVAGYATEQIRVSAGSMPASDVTVDVYYAPTNNQLNIYYIYADSNTEAAERVQRTDVATDTPYEVASPSIIGYTPSVSTVSGNMTAEGVTVYVYYEPNQYTVTFDAGEGGQITADSATATKTVAYNNIYGYDPTQPEADRYTELPQAYKSGYDFVGWYTAPDGGEKITEQTIVETAADHTLYARFESHQFTLTIHYQYTDSESEVRQYKHSYGEAYSYTHLAYEGYTPSVKGEQTQAVSGTMGLSNIVVTVDYSIDSHTVTVRTYVPDGSGGYTLKKTQQLSGNYNTGYSFTIDNLESEGYKAEADDYTISNHQDAEKIEGTRPVYVAPTSESGTAVAGSVSGRFGISDTVVDVYYSFIMYTLKINYVYEDGTEAFASHYSENHYVGEYIADIVSPEKEGYTPDLPVVGGKDFPAENVEGDVVYTKNKYTLTIHYVYSDLIRDTELAGTEVMPSHVETLEWGDPYSVPSPTVERYLYDYGIIEGVIKEDLEFTVYYFDDDTNIVDVTVTFGSLDYDFLGAIWNSETHTYSGEGGKLVPSSDVANEITVANSADSMALKAALSFAPNVSEDYSLSAKFTAEKDDSAESVSQFALPTGESKTHYMWLSGSLNLDAILRSLSGGRLSVGVCTVTISE